MQDFEQRALTTAPLKPSLWLRYVDDTFVVWNHGDKKLQSFLEHLNGQYAEIQFTMEKETEGSIPFLNVHVKKDKSKQAIQETHPHGPLPPLQLKPPSKGEVWPCRLPPSQSQWGSALADERMHVQKALMANRYPKQAIVKKRRKRRHGCRRGRPRVFLPYIKGISEKISRACQPLGVQVVFTSRDTLRKSHTNVKGRPVMNMKGVVYSIPKLCWRECSSNAKIIFKRLRF